MKQKAEILSKAREAQKRKREAEKTGKNDTDMLDYNVGHYESSIITELGEPHTRFHESYLMRKDYRREQTPKKKKKAEKKQDTRGDYYAGGF